MAYPPMDRQSSRQLAQSELEKALMELKAASVYAWRSVSEFC